MIIATRFFLGIHESVNLKQRKKPEPRGGSRRELLAFREKNRDLIGWELAEFSLVASRKSGWESIDCMRRHSRQARPQPKDPNQVFIIIRQRNSTGWKKRETFKEIAPRPDVTVLMAFTPGPNTRWSQSARFEGRSRHYRLSADTACRKAEYIRFRIVGDNQTLLNLIERRRDDRWATCTRDFTVPAGIKTLTVYVIAGSGDGGPIYLDNISLSRVDAGTEDAI